MAQELRLFGSTKLSTDISRNIKFLKSVYCIRKSNTCLYKEMNFSMTAHAKHTEIINRAIGLIRINVMNVKAFIFRRNKPADCTTLSKNSLCMYVTPALISRTITMMRRTFNSIFTCSRTIFRLFSSENPRLIKLSAMRTSFSRLLFSMKKSKTLFRAKLSDLFLTCDRAVAGLTSHGTSILERVN